MERGRGEKREEVEEDGEGERGCKGGGEGGWGRGTWKAREEVERGEG